MARPRRSRYTVTTSRSQKVVVLAHSADNAAEVVRRLAWKYGNPVEVVAGDYRCMRGAGFTLDLEAVEAAKELLGLTWPVRIDKSTRYTTKLGQYRSLRGTRVHTITLKAHMDPQEASETLWHELTHAMQAERHGDPAAFITAIAKERSARYGYKNRPTEREADEMAALMADLPLTRADYNPGRAGVYPR